MMSEKENRSSQTAEKSGSTSDGWIKTTCAYCGVGCGVEARPTAVGQLEIRGDQSHPANYGKLCTKGIALGETVIHDGRLLSPKMKPSLNTPGEEKPHPQEKPENTDWDHALSAVARRFRQIIETDGPDAIAFYVSGQLLTEDYYVANKLLKGFIGTANIDSNSRLCMASSVVGHKRAFGMDTVPVCYHDLEQTDLVVLVGSNLAWCHPVLFQRLRQAKQNNPELKVVVIDPRRNESCDIADQYLPVQPGSDVALYNGLLNYLVRHQAVDDTYISRHTSGFDAAVQLAAAQTNTTQLTGLNEAELTRFYQLFTRSDKVITIYSQGVNQSSQGSDKVNAIINCHLATGKIGLPGSGPFSVTGQPNAMGGREVGALANTLAAHMDFNPADLAQVADFWQTDRLAQQPGLKAVEMFDAIDQGQIKAVWIMATNPVVSLPDSEKIKRALAKCPLVVVSDCIEQTATTPFADVLLPAQGWSEKSGTVTNSERRISRQRRLLPSPGMARPDWWIITQVARRMGFEAQFSYRHEADIFREYARMTTAGNDREQRDLNLAGLVNLRDKDYQQLQPQQWPVLSYQTQIQHQQLLADGQFFTPERKARFIAVSHTPPKASVCKQFPLVLNSGRTRDHWHTMTRTGLSVSLADHTPEPYVLIHPQTAANYQVSHGELACIQNRSGRCLARVVASDTMKPGELFMPIHWNEVTASNSKPCVLIDARTDAHSGQPEFKFTPVTIAPYPVETQAILLVREPIHPDVFSYWARQKTDKGYRYQIAHRGSVTQVQQHISQWLPSGQVRQLHSELKTHHVLTISDQNKVLLLAVIGADLSGVDSDLLMQCWHSVLRQQPLPVDIHNHTLITG